MQSNERFCESISIAYMRPHPDQLAALVAIVERGTFEAAARQLHVTPSAVSQRIRGLESMAGQVLVRRSSPCAATPAGERAAPAGPADQPAVRRGGATPSTPRPADRSSSRSRSTPTRWTPGSAGCSRAVGEWEGVALRLHVEDQAYSADLLRRGDVLGAVTSDPVAVQGCVVEPLGTLRYRAGRGAGVRGAVAARARLRLGADADGGVQREGRRSSTTSSPPAASSPPPVVHRVPTSADFHEAVRLGLGWAAIPEPQLDPDLESGRLVLLSSRTHVDVLLHWQRWRLDSPLLERLTDAVRTAAKSTLTRR